MKVFLQTILVQTIYVACYWIIFFAYYGRVNDCGSLISHFDWCQTVHAYFVIQRNKKKNKFLNDIKDFFFNKFLEIIYENCQLFTA